MWKNVLGGYKMTDKKYHLEYDKILIVNPAIKLDNGEWLSDLSLNEGN